MSKESKEVSPADRMRVELERALRSADGLVIMRFLKRACGQEESSIVQRTDREISTSGTIINEARRGVYLDLLRHIPDSIRKTI